MWPAFPASDYYGSSAPSRRHQPTTDLPAHRPGGRPGRGPPGWFPRSLSTVRRGRRPAMPLQHRHGYAAGLHRGLPAGDINRPRSSPHDRRRVRAATQPRSARFELVGRLEGRSAAGSSRTPFRLACRTRTIWQCWPVPSLSGLLPPSPASPGQAALSFTGRCDGPAAVAFHLRTVTRAPRGARSPPPRAGWAGLPPEMTRSTRSSAVANPGDATPLAGAVPTGDPGALHQHRDRVVTDHGPPAEGRARHCTRLAP